MRQKGKVYNGIIFKRRRTRGVPPLTLSHDSAHHMPCRQRFRMGGGLRRIVANRNLWFFTESWGKSSLGARLRTRKVTGRDASLPAPLLSAFKMLVARGTVGALPQTPQGTLSLDPARGNCPLTPFRDWVGRAFMLLPRAAFWGLRLSPCLLPQLSVKNPIRTAGCTLFAPLYTKSLQKECALL